jgi:hypothetical protein
VFPVSHFNRLQPHHHYRHQQLHQTILRVNHGHGHGRDHGGDHVLEAKKKVYFK